MTKSALQIARAAYQPKLPKGLQGNVKAVAGEPTQSVADMEEIKKLFPNTYGMPLIKFENTNEASSFAPMNVGVILSGGQAPGGHNVISGLFDGLKKLNPANRLYGFLMGPGGLVDHNYKELTADIIDEYRNTGGFDIIGSGRTKLEKEDQFEKGYEILKELDIKALVIIGGDDSNTNACVLAEYYAAKNYGIQVIGCPKTIDGDLKNDQIETSFGFDTACKTYSEVIGNIERDCNSARKYWHFIKLMGRSASHIALECALQVQPNYTIISEEVEAKDLSLDDIVTSIARTVADRAAEGNNFGTVLIPEGLIEFIPACGYEGRCAAPSNFDADYCYSLGVTASALIANGKTGYMASVKNLTAPADRWVAGGIPITMMFNMERRNGEMKPVIRKALVDLNGKPFKALVAHRAEWAKQTAFVYPGPIQYFGPTEVCDQPTKTLQLEQA